jgi:hypothetical protein
MQRNTLFGGLALLLAGGVIGAGAMISSSAMAAEESPPPANQLTMVNVGADGEAVQCTFEGAEVDGLFPELPAAAPDQELPAGAVPVGGSGTIEGVGVGFGVAVSPDGSEGELLDITELPVAMEVVSLDEAREGTPEECAAMREQATSGVAVTGSMVIGSTGVDLATP